MFCLLAWFVHSQTSLMIKLCVVWNCVNYANTIVNQYIHPNGPKTLKFQLRFTPCQCRSPLQGEWMGVRRTTIQICDGMDADHFYTTRGTVNSPEYKKLFPDRFLAAILPRCPREFPCRQWLGCEDCVLHGAPASHPPVPLSPFAMCNWFI